MSKAETRLLRLINIVAFLQNKKVSSIDELSQNFDVSKKQIVSDINQLWMCGLPGYGPGDLIDFEINKELVKIVFNAGIDQPLNFNNIENFQLLFALDSISKIPNFVTKEEIEELKNKLLLNKEDIIEKILSSSENLAFPFIKKSILEIIQNGEVISIEYFSKTNNINTNRDILPLKLIFENEDFYIYAWCFLRNDYRYFKLDRITNALLSKKKNFTKREEKFKVRDNLELPAKTVKLYIKENAFWISEFPYIQIISEENNFKIVNLYYYSVEWLISFIKANLPHIFILEDQSLKALLFKSINNLAK